MSFFSEFPASVCSGGCRQARRLELTPYRPQDFDAAVQLCSRWSKYCDHPMAYVLRKKHARGTNKPMKMMVLRNGRELQTLSHTQPFDIDSEDERRLSMKRNALPKTRNPMSTSRSHLIYLVSQYRFIIMQSKILLRACSSVHSFSSGLTLRIFLSPPASKIKGPSALVLGESSVFYERRVW